MRQKSVRWGLCRKIWEADWLEAWLQVFQLLIACGWWLLFHFSQSSLLLSLPKSSPPTLLSDNFISEKLVLSRKWLINAPTLATGLHASLVQKLTPAATCAEAKESKSTPPEYFRCRNFYWDIGKRGEFNWIKRSNLLTLSLSLSLLATTRCPREDIQAAQTLSARIKLLQ